MASTGEDGEEGGQAAGRGGKRPLRLGVLVSGNGTNLQAILDEIAAGRLEAGVAVVISNRAGARAVARANAAGVPCEIYERGAFATRRDQQQAIAGRLAEAQVDLVVCAGWDRILEYPVIERFAGRIINIHPSLLPAFAGSLRAIEEAFEYGVRITGCTVHFVTEEVDGGPVIAQAAVEVRDDDTVDSLAERIHREEHRILVGAIRMFGEEGLCLEGRRVHSGR